MRALRVALGFLTAFPLESPADLGREDLGRAAALFPLVGLMLGGALALGDRLLGLVFPPRLNAVLVVALWAALTGGLHLDGLADCCDGLLASATPGRRLEILRDARVGAFGAVGLVLFLLVKVSAVGALTDPRPLLLAPALGRWALLIGGAMPPARREGLGAAFHAGLGRPALAVAAVTSAVAAGLFGWRGLVAFLAAHAVVFGLLRLARARLGGVTGDVLGAACELAEASALLAFGARGWP